MAYTERTYEGWGSRLGKAFRGVIIGILLVIAATVLLYWNEERTFKTAGAIGEAERVTQKVDDISSVNPDLNGKLIYAKGRALTEETVTDPIFGANSVAIAVERGVEYYQWVEHSSTRTEKKVGGGEETITTYTYSKKWVSSPVDSNSFHDPEYQGRNSLLAEFEDETFYAQNVTFGAYRLPDILKERISGAVPLNITPTSADLANVASFLPFYRSQVSDALPEEQPAEPDGNKQDLTGTSPDLVPEMPLETEAGKALKMKIALGIARSWIHSQGNVLYIGKNQNSPDIGDVKVTFRQIPPAEVSVIAQVTGDTFEEFTASNGYPFIRLQMGAVAMPQMFQGARRENTLTAWLIRVVGAFLVYLGLSMIFNPLSVLADVLPFLGTMVGWITGFAAFLLGVAWALVVIAVAWLRFRPILAGGLIAAALALVVLSYKKRDKSPRRSSKKRKAAAPPEEEEEELEEEEYAEEEEDDK